MHVVLWLSDNSWDSLSGAAFSLGWIRSINTISQPGYTSRNIGRYFEALASLDYADRRPDQLTDTNVWQTGEAVREHHVRVSTTALTLLAAIAANYRMLPRWYAAMLFNERVKATLDQDAYADVFANPKTSLTTMATAALEAIGCGYLTAPVYPQAPPTLFKHPDYRATPDKKQQHVAFRYGY